MSVYSTMLELVITCNMTNARPTQYNVKIDFTFFIVSENVFDISVS